MPVLWWKNKSMKGQHNWFVMFYTSPFLESFQFIFILLKFIFVKKSLLNRFHVIKNIWKTVNMKTITREEGGIQKKMSNHQYKTSQTSLVSYFFPSNYLLAGLKDPTLYMPMITDWLTSCWEFKINHSRPGVYGWPHKKICTKSKSALFLNVFETI